MSLFLPAVGLLAAAAPVPAIIEARDCAPLPAEIAADPWRHLWRIGDREIAARPLFVVPRKGVIERVDGTLEIFDPRLLTLSTMGLIPLARPELTLSLKNTADYTSGSGTYTTPAGIYQLVDELIGGGGSGGAGTSNTGGGGGAGAGRVTLSTSPGSAYPYSVGIPGVSSTSNGSPTTFNSTHQALGGTTAEGSNGSVGGPGGATSGLDEGHTGGTGGTGNAVTGGGGSGASAASPDADGNDGLDGQSGGVGAAGGASPGGLAGAGGDCAAFNQGNVSDDGHDYGGGGSGAAGGAGTGPGQGAGGHLRVKEYGY